MMRVASIQLKGVEGSKEKTLDHAAEMVRRCRGADVVLLPELWNIGFMSFDRYKPEAEDREGPTLSLMRSLARELSCLLHTGSFVEKDGDRYYNSSFLLGPKGEILGNYRKIHLFTYQSKEGEILTRGPSITVVPTDRGAFGMATCYDLRFPELFRMMLDRGAEFFLVCSAWPLVRLEHWLLLNRSRALENFAFLVSANSTGMSEGAEMGGHGMIVEPTGQVVASGTKEEGIVLGEIDREAVLKARATFPALRDRVYKSCP
jgi:predicted amidohydrolase